MQKYRYRDHCKVLKTVYFCFFRAYENGCKSHQNLSFHLLPFSSYIRSSSGVFVLKHAVIHLISSLSSPMFLPQTFPSATTCHCKRVFGDTKSSSEVDELPPFQRQQTAP